MKDTKHLVALQDGLKHEQARLASAKKSNEIALRTVWVKQLEKQIADEMRFLGIEEIVECDLSDDDLLAELLG